MPTTLPRVMISLKPEINEILETISRQRRASKAELVTDFVEVALRLMEDMALAEIANERLKTFNLDESFTSDQLLERLNSRKRKKK